MLTQVVYVLKECVWNYMKDHVPSPVLFVCDPTGFHWRDPQTSRPPVQYTNPLRNTMQKKLPKVGHLYNQMFVVPELRNPTVSNVAPAAVMVNGLGGPPVGVTTNGNGPIGSVNGNGHHLAMVINNSNNNNSAAAPVVLGPIVTLD